jgi:hypothetical protein
LGVRISKLLTTTALVFFVIIVYQLYMILYWSIKWPSFS